MCVCDKLDVHMRARHCSSSIISFSTSHFLPLLYSSVPHFLPLSLPLPPSPFLVRFFDRTGCGYFKQDDCRRLLHSLGLGLSYRMVRDIASAAVEASARASAAPGSRAPSSDR